MANDVCEFVCNKCGHTWEVLKKNIKKNGWPKRCPNLGCSDFECECGCTSAAGCKCDDCGCDKDSSCNSKCNKSCKNNGPRVHVNLNKKK
ncbi:hypothetical protein L6259_01010 [Candidatus Parcubacteria bacterium]|nr:hypothetical protein [Patescibacteria group bacterium]MCG2693852.1 hypothetical protein [Candidatus Parcubacteria bacterium]